MKTVQTFFISFLLIFTFMQVNAQNEPTADLYKTETYTGFYLGGSASTNGWGFNARYAFTNWFSLKSGFETLNLSYNVDFDEDNIGYTADFDYKTGGILLLLDFSYTKNLYLSTGVVFNSLNPKVVGVAVEDLEFGDIIIPSEDIGNFEISLEPGLKASPYIGAGYQAFMGKSKRLVFNFETGLYYIGPPDFTIESDGLLEPTSNPAFGQEEYLESQFDAYKIYPIIKLNLAFRIF